MHRRKPLRHERVPLVPRLEGSMSLELLSAHHTGDAIVKLGISPGGQARVLILRP